MQPLIRSLPIFSLVLFLTGCASVEKVGEIGPKKLKVYSISHNGFLTASNMIVVLDEKGNVGTSTGGTVAGAGTVGLQTATSIVSSGAIFYGAKALQHGIENAKISGIPSNYNINANIDASAHIKQH